MTKEKAKEKTKKSKTKVRSPKITKDKSKSKKKEKRDGRTEAQVADRELLPIDNHQNGTVRNSIYTFELTIDKDIHHLNFFYFCDYILFFTVGDWILDTT